MRRYMTVPFYLSIKQYTHQLKCISVLTKHLGQTEENLDKFIMKHYLITISETIMIELCSVFKHEIKNRTTVQFLKTHY